MSGQGGSAASQGDQPADEGTVRYEQTLAAGGSVRL